MSFSKIDQLLKARLKERGYGRQVDALEIIRVAEVFFNLRFPSVYHKLQVISFKFGNLTIASQSAPIAVELKIYEKEILKEINNKLGKDLVKKMRVLI